MSEIPRHSRVLYSPADEHPPQLPRWSRPRSSSIASSRRSKKTRLAAAKTRFRKLSRWARKRFKAMTLLQKLLVSTLLLISITLGILTLVFHTQILAAMLPISSKLRSWPAGWLIIFTVCFFSAFPPMIGYSTSVTLAGFVYGYPNGWFIVASATVIGSTSAFLACRHLFRDFTRRVVSTDRRFEALSMTLKHDGLKLLCMIRLCPLPYSISNGAVSTFPTVTPLAFTFATALATPKLMIHIWIGQRLAILAAAEQKMDGKTKALNYCSIAGGIILGVLTGWIIYKRTLKRPAQLEAEERARGEVEEEGLLVVPDEDFEDMREDVEQDLGILMGDETSDDDVEDDEEVSALGRRGRSIGHSS
ncbi:hypothetical protein K440DRAFT_655405 [Wilcoxina mikolae CBS 423.85]|nr:hypothetical protein K440DRAFT_655405 [Wilcoxina mikolae CBS 423.85]